jgi:hypothetical protein
LLDDGNMLHVLLPEKRELRSDRGEEL